MGAAQDIMQTFAAKEIRAHFREFDGWDCQQAPLPVSRDTAYFISRDLRGRRETVALAVSFDEAPTDTALAAAVAGWKGKKPVKGQYMLVPKDADVSAVPGHVRILSMTALGVVDGNLVWLTKKKNVKHYAQQDEPAKAGVPTPACEPHAA